MNRTPKSETGLLPDFLGVAARDGQGALHLDAELGATGYGGTLAGEPSPRGPGDASPAPGRDGSPTPRKAYHPPTLRRLGSVVELTGMVIGSVGDGGIGRQPKHTG